MTLGSHEAVLSGSGSEIEDGFARLDVLGRVAAAVVALQHFCRDRLEQLRVVRGRAAEAGFACFCRSRVTGADGLVYIECHICLFWSLPSASEVVASCCPFFAPDAWPVWLTLSRLAVPLPREGTGVAPVR